MLGSVVWSSSCSGSRAGLSVVVVDVDVVSLLVGVVIVKEKGVVRVCGDDGGGGGKKEDERGATR